MPRQLFAATLALHYAPSVRLAAGDCAATIDARTRGVLTGTRSAGDLGRVITSDVAFKVATSHLCLPTRLPTADLPLATWIDNLYAFGESRGSAVQMIEASDRLLRREWELHLKPSSRQVTTSGGKAEQPVPEGWEQVAFQSVLGITVSGSGAPSAALAALRRRMWASFFGKRVRKALQAATLDRRVQLLHNHLFPIVAYAATGIPPTRQTADFIDAEQRKMCSMLASNCPRQGEDAENFH